MNEQKFDQCSKCGATLSSVIEASRRKTDFPQMHGALVLEIIGGYGMYQDEPDTVAILCNSCAEEFFNTNPWLRGWVAMYAGNRLYHH